VTGHIMIVDGGITGSGGMGRQRQWATDIIGAPPFSEWLNHDPQP